MLATLIDALRPGAPAVERLAQRETDPAFAYAFEPITPGPFAAAALLLLIAAAGAALAPLRLLLRRSIE